MFTDQMKSAALRALYGAVIAAGVAGFAILAAGGGLHWAEIAAGGAFFSTLATRAGVEGAYDSRRNATGNVKRADVGARYVGR